MIEVWCYCNSLQSCLYLRWEDWYRKYLHFFMRLSLLPGSCLRNAFCMYSWMELTLCLLFVWIQIKNFSPLIGIAFPYFSLISLRITLKHLNLGSMSRLSLIEKLVLKCAGSEAILLWIPPDFSELMKSELGSYLIIFLSYSILFSISRSLSPCAS